jgi:hypothetical protein
MYRARWVVSSQCSTTYIYFFRFEFDDPFMNKMMTIQRDLEKSFTHPSAILMVLPMMKHFPSAVMRGVRQFKKVFHAFLDETLDSHMESYNSGM